MLQSQPTTLVAETSPQLKSEEQQKKERRELYLRCILTGLEYELYGFARRGIDYAYMMNFLTIHDLRNRFRPALNDTAWKQVLDNKWFFQLHYERHGLQLPKAYGVYQPGSGIDLDGRPLGTPGALRALLEEHRPTSLVIKPMGGIMGQGILILDELLYERGNITAITNTGRTLQFDEIASKLDTPPNVVYQMTTYRLELPGYILQAKLSQHPLLNKISPHTVNTMRVVTLLDRSGNVHVQCAVLRAGRRGNTADNWEQGGISIGIDCATGVLGKGVLKPKYGGQWVDSHPDTGCVFEGLQLPYWTEVLDLCSRAAIATPGLRTIGWDVAMTPTGPVLIEGNPDWDLPMVQVHTRGLLQPEARKILAEFDLSFPEGTLPPVSFRKWNERFQDYRLSNGPTRPERLMRLLLDPPLLFDKVASRLSKGRSQA